MAGTADEACEAAPSRRADGFLVTTSLPVRPSPASSRHASRASEPAKRSPASSAWLSTAATECWSYVASIDSFELCTTDQYIRVFPRLLPANGIVPVALRAHMTRCLAVLAWRASLNADGASMIALCATPKLGAGEIIALGMREHDRWFPRPADAAGLPGSAPACPPSTDGVAEQHEAIVLVAALREEIDRGTLRSFDPETAALFAFATGIHAAYLWPEALLSHEFYSAIGWLGHLWRGRHASMPADLAAYFDDVIDPEADGRLRVRDRHLARFLPEPRVVAEVWRAAQARRDRAAAVATWPRAAPSGIAGLAAERTTPSRREVGPW